MIFSCFDYLTVRIGSGLFWLIAHVFLDLYFKGIRIIQIPISVKYFKDRKSKVAGNLFSYAYKTFNIIVRSIVYYKPLRFFGYPGMFLLSLGLFFVIFLLGHKIFIGSFSPYKAYGFIGGGLMTFGLIVILMGLVSDIIDKVRQTQDKILYYAKKRENLAIKIQKISSFPAQKSIQGMRLK